MMDASIDPEDLVEMKYAELRKVAKSVGIKANQKADKLIKALQDYIVRQRIDTGKPATPDVSRSRVLTPLRKSVGRLGTPVGASVVKPATPVSAPRSQPSTPKRFTPLHRLRTPPTSSRSGSLLLLPPGGDGDTCTPTGSVAPSKRSRTASSGNMQSAKKLRTVEAFSDASSGVTTPRHQRSRSNTYNKATVLTTPGGDSSPGTLDLIESMAETECEAERKEKLMAALNKKVQQKMGKGNQIPRFVAFCALKKQATEESAKKRTPGETRYLKAHTKNFDKMVSLDQYLENKKRRTEVLSGSAKKAYAEETSSALKKLKALTEGSPIVKRAEVRRRLVKTPVHSASGVPFVPKVTSVVKVNFNFSAVKKTPGLLTRSKFESADAAVKGKENVVKSATHLRQKSMSSTVTPFKFAANLNKSLNSSLSKSVVKPKFDLCASLTRPITWKPHTGKLKPFVAPTNFRRDVKAVNVTTKDDRRKQTKTYQAKNRHGTQMKRRGLQA